MSTLATDDAYGTLSKDNTLTIHRMLPGPVERVWRYLTDSDLRRQWLAAGDMTLKAGAPFEFVWRNDELTNPPGVRPEGFSVVHRKELTITECDPPRRLSFTWGNSGDVTFALEPKGERVMLTVIHRRLPDRDTILKVGPGWHGHLDVLTARLSGTTPKPFWDNWTILQKEYARRVAA